MKWRTIIRYFVVPAVALVLTFKIYSWISYLLLKPDYDNKVTSSGEAVIGGGFTLFDQNNKIVASSDFNGKLMLVYFGFSNCPDICPTDLALISNVMQQLGEDAKKIQPIFITVDPERDTPEQLKTYLSNFDPSIIGLTGTREQIAEVLHKYRIFAKKVAEEGGEPGKSGHEGHSMHGNYMMDHSAYIYLMGKDAKYLTHFNSKQEVAAIMQKIRDNF